MHQWAGQIFFAVNKPFRTIVQIQLDGRIGDNFLQLLHCFVQFVSQLAQDDSVRFVFRDSFPKVRVVTSSADFKHDRVFFVWSVGDYIVDNFSKRCRAPPHGKIEYELFDSFEI